MDGWECVLVRATWNNILTISSTKWIRFAYSLGKFMTENCSVAFMIWQFVSSFQHFYGYAAVIQALPKSQLLAKRSTSRSLSLYRSHQIQIEIFNTLHKYNINYSWRFIFLFFFSHIFLWLFVDLPRNDITRLKKKKKNAQNHGNIINIMEFVCSGHRVWDLSVHPFAAASGMRQAQKTICWPSVNRKSIKKTYFHQ